ncbi:MAG TPA: Os1348 family NHLP clan protein [Candidatus Methylomirabilis sp.]|nr:Os1348 family NHLP clan protein [Candidatus Methylomirabilis sp.]
MSQPAVERAHGKMITDPFFRDRFFEDPAGTSASAGLDLSQGN